MRPHLPTLAAVSLLASTAFAQPAMQQTKVFTFPAIQAGACTMPAGATMTLSADGTGTWKASSTTASSPAKVMQVQLYGEAEDGTPLFFSGNFASPRMEPGHHYEWGGTVKFDPGLLPAIHLMRAWSSC